MVRNAVTNAPETEGVLKPSNHGNDLSQNEISLLKQCENTISSHLAAFLQVGSALLQIRSQRLYRAEFRTFDEYCRVRWSISRVHAHRLLSASEFVEKNLLPTGNTPLPENERQIRPLVGLKPEEAKGIWEKAVKDSNGQKLTAKMVADSVSASKEAPSVKKVQPTELWQDQVIPLIKQALQAARSGDRESVINLLFKAQLHLEIGRTNIPREDVAYGF